MKHIIYLLFWILCLLSANCFSASSEAQTIHEHMMSTPSHNHESAGDPEKQMSNLVAGHNDHHPHHQHPGLPINYIWPSTVIMAIILFRAIFAGVPHQRPAITYNLVRLPIIGRLIRWLNISPWPLIAVKLISVTVFLIVVYAGLFGSPLPERNLATTFVWNLWWPLVVIAVFFLGTVWCGICPWDAIATWIVRRRLWKRVLPHPGFNLKVPQFLRSVWPALFLFMGLTWLELGIGITTLPMTTALLAVIMVILATISLILFERKAFCRYFCPVGRTLGFYSRLAPIAIRAQDQTICTTCSTLECYHGSRDIEPCPTHLTVGRFSQNTYCLSCGNCVLSCPHQNVSWQLRPLASEARAEARRMWDGAWFMLALLGITSFHGMTMTPLWQSWLNNMARLLGETGMPIESFTIGMGISFLAPIVLYAVAIGLTRLLAPTTEFKILFVTLPFSTLPLAFSYHLAHNLDHLYREPIDMWNIFANPTGAGLTAMTVAERHLFAAGGGLSEQILFIVQAGLMTLGLWLAVEILRYRGLGLLTNKSHLSGGRLTPMLAFITTITAFNLWLMAQNMSGRF